MKYKDLESMVESVMLEVKRGRKQYSERQERDFIRAINDAIKQNDGKPIHVQFENGYYMPSVIGACLLYTSPSPRDVEESRMPSSA